VYATTEDRAFMKNQDVWYSVNFADKTSVRRLECKNIRERYFSNKLWGYTE
jgi:hypothetical protein